METEFLRSVTVYGVGLIGSSFALALKQRSPGVRVYGVDKPDVLDRARQLGVIEAGDPEASDLLILAAPVGDILNLLDELRPGPHVVLDVGSTKMDICNKAERRGLPFVGGHPMTGSERSGPEAATAEIFKGARFFLCPISTTPKDAIPKLEEMIKSIGAWPRVISAGDHDRLVAKISHLPQILSTLLAEHTSEHHDLAGPGLKSVTRLAASPFHVWRDILKTSGFLPQELQAFIERLRVVLGALEGKGVDDLAKIEMIFERANQAVGAVSHRALPGAPHE